MENCLYCGKKLLPFKNDWKYRKYHKTCYKKKQEEIRYQLFLEYCSNTTKSEVCSEKQP